MKENKKRHWIVALSLILMFLGRFIGGGSSQIQVICIFIGTLILWMTQAIDWPSLLCLLALSFVPELKLNQLLSGSIGSSTFAFLMFTFMCTYALGKTSFISRFALFFLNTKQCRKGGWSFILSYFIAVLLLGLFTSPTVLVVVMIPLTEEIFHLLKLEKHDSIPKMMMGGMVFVSSIAAGMTPVAHVFPLMAMEFYTNVTGTVISYLDFMKVAFPLGILTFLAMMGLFYMILRPSLDKLGQVDLASLKKDLPKITLKEKWIVAIFFGVVCLWVLPDVFISITPTLSNAIKAYGNAMPPLLGASLLLVISIEGETLLDFKEAFSKGIPWSSLMMVAATLSLGSALTNEDIGLVTTITSTISPLLNAISPMFVIFIFICWASIQTNLSSNMVTVTVVCTVAIPLAISLGTLSVETVACLIGIMASYAFATPPAMATIAFVIGSDWTDASFMFKYGMILMIVAIVLATCIGYPLGLVIFG